MHLVKKVLVTVSLAVTAVVVPTSPALAHDCAGTVLFISGSPTVSTEDPTKDIRVWSPPVVSVGDTHDFRGTFHTQGPGHKIDHCDAGWVTTCQMEIDGVPVSPVECPTHYAPDSSVCPSAPPCGVDVVSTQRLSRGEHTVTVRLGMKWGCCRWKGGPEHVAEGSWLVAEGCIDACKKVDGAAWILNLVP